MRIITLSLFLAFFTAASFVSRPGTTPVSPLAIYSAEWNNPVYLKFNTAKDANYMTGSEKEVIYILNLLQDQSCIVCPNSSQTIS